MAQIVRGAGSTITAIKHGNTDIIEVRRGTQLVWSKAALRIDFRTLDDQVGLGANWTDYGNASVPTSAAPYVASVGGGQCRINLPDGESFIAGKRDRQRYNAVTTTSDDGYLEIKIGSRGDWDGAFSTIVYDHVNNTGFDDGIGIGLWANSLHIVRRVAGVETTMDDCDGFQSGDIVRMVHLNQGKLHQLYRNGRLVGVWDDSAGTAHIGSGNRSVGLSVYGRKDSFLTPRRYSPGIDYIEAGGGDRRIRLVATDRRSFFSKRTVAVSFDNYTPVENDLVMVFATTSEGVGAGISPPAGWVSTPSNTGVSSDAHSAYLAYHLVTAAEAAAGQTSWSLPTFLNSGVNSGIAGVVFRGVDPTTPIDSVATGFNSGNTTTPHVFPGLPGASLSNRSLVVGFMSADNGPVYNNPPAGWSQELRSSPNTPSRAVCTRLALTQAGVNVLPANITPSFGDEYAAITVALTELLSS